jgi:hypothetical protein
MEVDMTKKRMIFLFIILLVSLSLSAEYLILKDGKKIKIDGAYKIEGQSVIFKMPGSDLDISLPLDKIDLEKTKAVNTVKETNKDDKKTKVFTNKDIKSQDKVIDTTEDPGDENESTTENQGPEVQSIPSYAIDDLATRDVEWWTAEVTRVQNMLQEALKLNRKAINDYNDIIMNFNSRRDNERAALKPQVDAKAEAIKQSKELAKSWYNAIQALHNFGLELGKEQWLLKPLSETLESFKEMVE